jgi:hypothetical protein
MSSQVLFRPFRACRQEKEGFSDPGRWPIRANLRQNPCAGGPLPLIRAKIGKPELNFHLPRRGLDRQLTARILYEWLTIPRMLVGDLAAATYARELTLGLP